ncbi:signal recognition particle-docking protein FtsY [Vampirovibrio chlorellavorus]|uniref:signal recognition particle-docking protein FtsY n=1 Tax=Vampirovibrio chlorellavorus TaxID=758823 RepID=UPI0026EC1567|nr:signal recognition particle-docking protein FtsY [Vampirovibrio chlorellavorus]
MFNWFGKKTTDAATGTETLPPPADESALGSLRNAVALTGKSIVGKIFGLLKESEIDQDTIDEIEEILIRADVGLETATRISERIRQRKDELGISEQMMTFLRQEFLDILTPFQQANQLRFEPGKMNVYLVVGVNGAGKTTFIGKLANRFIQQGKTVVIGAGDTFRAAAEEQLEVWAQRAGATFVGAGNAKDPAAVIYEALKQAREAQADVVLLDTAGRLQNKFNLMEELRKIRKVIDQGMPEGAILESLLVLDATTGQNALKQASVFKETVDLSGVVLTKLDGSAKGGVILTIAQEYRLPVKMVGVGEGIADLKDFSATEFIDALFEK